LLLKINKRKEVLYMEIYIGTILPWAGNYEPQGFMFCKGQTLQINQYNALYAVLGTTYGGNGSSTFMLPNLQGCFPIGAGVDAFSNAWNPGQCAKRSTKVVLQTQNMPQHTHAISNNVTSNATNVNLSLDVAIPVSTTLGTDSNPGIDSTTKKQKVLAAARVGVGSTSVNLYSQAGSTGDTLQPFTVQQNVALPAADTKVVSTAAPLGGNIPVDVTPPYLSLNFIIAVQGLFPPRNN
jgi:microcystin-dependent protein